MSSLTPQLELDLDEAALLHTGKKINNISMHNMKDEWALCLSSPKKRECEYHHCLCWCIAKVKLL